MQNKLEGLCQVKESGEDGWTDKVVTGYCNRTDWDYECGSFSASCGVTFYPTPELAARTEGDREVVEVEVKFKRTVIAGDSRSVS